MSTTSTINIYQLAARQKKAARLIEVLVRRNITHTLASRMTPDEWLTVATEAHVTPPSESTRAMVLDSLKTMETL